MLAIFFAALRKTQKQHPEDGFALPIAIALGMVMIALGTTSLLIAQSDRNNASARQQSGASLLVGDSAISRVLVQLSKPNNGLLLTRNYDPINAKTDKNYLGPDGVPNSGDETGTALDEWTGYDPSTKPCFQQVGRNSPNMALTGSIGTEGTYTIRAYRYDKAQKSGTVLVEGNYKGQASMVAITLAIEPVLDDFPGIALINPTNGATANSPGVIALRGREILGSKGNVYYMPYNSADPSLTASSAPEDTTRPSYLNAIRSSDTQDGASEDTVDGKIFACQLTPSIPQGIQGTNLGVITTSQTVKGVGGNVPTLYRIEEVDLDNNEILTIDTTGGPVYFDVINNGSGRGITLRDTAQILNIRTDGKTPRVGDLRFMARQDSVVTLYNKTCIQNAFLWFYLDELRLLTSGPGCPGGQNTNFEGVAWMEAILSSKNASGNRNVNYRGVTGRNYDTLVTPGATSGLAVPDDLTSLIDLLEYVDWPVKYQYGAIKNWQRVN
jgi:hypothetical protein